MSWCGGAVPLAWVSDPVEPGSGVWVGRQSLGSGETGAGWSGGPERRQALEGSPGAGHGMGSRGGDSVPASRAWACPNHLPSPPPGSPPGTPQS